MDDRKKPLLILTGPTATGKTETAIRLAKACNGEIISADSMQVYRQMDIGTAKISREEMGGIPHYMIDELEPDEEFNVFLFQKKAKQYMSDIYARGKIPILVGGTGFYIQAVLYDIDFTKGTQDSTCREKLQREAREQGAEKLYEKLLAVDPDYAKTVHANNVKRVIRALEYHMLTGETFSAHNREQSQKCSPYQFAYFVLDMEREKLYRRIDLRVDRMMERGLAGEVERLLDKGYSRSLVSMQGLGYKEIASALCGACTMEEAVSLLKKNTRHFAKRQLTWFRRERDVCIIETECYEDVDAMATAMLHIAKERGVLHL